MADTGDRGAQYRKATRCEGCRKHSRHERAGFDLDFGRRRIRIAAVGLDLLGEEPS